MLPATGVGFQYLLRSFCMYTILCWVLGCRGELAFLQPLCSFSVEDTELKGERRDWSLEETREELEG